jgi:cleavage and polyadenylation specificity factor subunit 3
MLQKGLSRRLFEKWCHDDKNGVIFTGYCVEGTLASEIIGGQRFVKGVDGQDLHVKMSVDNISFCAHADCNQTIDFIRALEPKHIVLVHGEYHEAEKLQKK